MAYSVEVDGSAEVELVALEPDRDLVELLRRERPLEWRAVKEISQMDLPNVDLTIPSCAAIGDVDGDGRPDVRPDLLLGSPNGISPGFRDPEVTRFLEARDLTRQAVLDHLEEGRRSGTDFMFAVCLRENDLHVGNLKVGPMNRKHGISDLVTVIGDKGHWGRGLATEAVRLGTRPAFEVYQVRKLYAGMYAENVGSIRAYLKAGWKEEGRLRDHHIVDGNTMDRVCVCAFNPRCSREGKDEEAK